MLNLSKQIRVGWDTQAATSKYNLPEAEIIPDGETLNERKRLKTVLKKYMKVLEYDNVPLPGFTLYKIGRKTWGSSDNSWLVIDPRGFLVRISSQNLEKILHVTGITEGLIQEKCVWAREDNQTKMTLVPISSPSYAEAIRNTKLIEGRINVKDVQIGDTVITQGGFQGIYRGTLSLYGALHQDGRHFIPQSFLRRQIIELDSKKFFYQTDIKILKVIKARDREITREESAAYLTKAANDNSIFSSSGYFGGYFSSRGLINYVSTTAIQKPKISLIEIDREEAESIFDLSIFHNNMGNLLFEQDNGELYILVVPIHYGSRAFIYKNNFEVKEVTIDPSHEKISVKPIDLEDKEESRVYSLDNFKKYYKIVKHVKNETYV